MALLNAAERKKLNDADFAYIDSKGGRHLPVQDAAHTRDAMARFDQQSFESDAKKASARRKILAAAKKFGIDVAKFSEDTGGHEEPMFTADFSGDGTPEGDVVIRTGKLFECGNYPDKSFSLTPEEMEEAVATFTPVPLDIGDAHGATVLEGKMGHVARIFAGDDGTSLMGEVHLPKWLDGLLEEGQRKVSTEWDRATKTLSRLAIVRNPRVSDAALMSAYEAAQPQDDPTFAGKRHDTGSGQYAIQRIHDAAASGGAVCGKPATMASRHEATAMQQVHDTAVAHGAKCESITDGRGYGMFSDTKQTPTRSRRMKILEYLTGKAKEEGVEIDTSELDAAFSTGTEVESLKAELAKRDEALKALSAAQERHTADFARIEAQRRQSDAASFAAGQVASFRVTPGAAEKLVPLMERIATLDSTATFADGAESTTALLEAFVSSLPDLSVFTTDHIKPETAAALFNISKTPGVTGKDEPNLAVVERILQSTPDGRAILAERKAGK